LPEPDALIDFSTSIVEAVEETQFALIFGSILAILTVFVFLRRTRPTLIVAAAIPLSIVSTFGVMWLFDFTLNIMTLLALTLAVGVVIDDSIVVLENIERHREAGASPRDAASRGTRQIAFAATSATVSIAVVFLPVVFVTGIVGSFLSEFGLTVASAVMISLFVALTLTPMLAARMSPPAPRAHGSVYHRLEQGFAWLESSYRRLLYWALSHRTATLGVAGGSFVLALVFGSALGAEFFPPSDEGRLFVMMETPPGTTLQGTYERAALAERWMLDQPEVKGLFAGIGVAGPGGPGTVTNAVMVAILTSQSERERSAMDLQRDAREALSQIPGLSVQVWNPSGFRGGGSGEFEFHVRGDISIAELDEISSRFMRELATVPGFADLKKSLKVGLPEVRVIPDRDKAAALGVDARSIARVIQATIGGLDVATFKEGGHRYDVRMRLEQDDRDKPSSIQRLYVRGRDGQIHELRNLVKIETGAAPSTITRHNRRRSVTIGSSLEGIPVGQAIEQVRAIADEILPDGVNLSFSGSAKEFLESLSQFGLMIGLAILVIYMVLAAQFESLVHPLTVMLALPLAMVGALGGLWAMGMTLNLFSLIGIILLLGLVTKNSILLVDFANHLRAEEGLDKLEAMRRAAPIRMRPVLMTAFSMIFGVLPAALGLGPGSETRAPMAVATAAGMFSSTLLTLVVVPVFYLVLDDGVDWLRSQLRRSRPSAGDPGVRSVPQFPEEK
jgi:HAE1 family hydrophobic/amphiphilic exporter-1